MSNEKNPIRDGIIVAVASAIILAILAWIFDGVFEVIKAIFNWVASSLIYAWSYLQTPVTITWGALWLLSIFSFIALWKMLRPFISSLIKRDTNPKPYKPNLDDYREDVVFNVKWEWSYIYGTLPNEPAGFCSNCSTRLVYTIEGYPEKTSFICQKCGRTVASLDGNLDYALGTVAREIERRIKTNEWQHKVIRQHNQKTG